MSGRNQPLPGRPRVLFMGPLPPPDGGVSYLCRSLLETGLGEGLQLELLSTGKGTPREDIGRVTATDVCSAIGCAVRLSGMLARFRPQIFHLATTANAAVYRDTAYMLLARAFGARVLLNLHGSDDPVRPRWRRTHPPFVRFAATLADRITVPTEGAASGLRNVYRSSRPVEVMRNTASIPESLKTARSRAPNRSSGPRLTGIGRLSEAKGAWDLIRAMPGVLARFPDARLTWIGLGAYQRDDRHARQLVEALELDGFVRLAGRLSDSDKFAVLADTDIFVLPSHTEGFPLALAEAMGGGLPVVTTPVGGIPEIVLDPRNGLLTPLRDPAALVEAVCRLWSDRDLMEQQGRANAEFYDRVFDPRVAVRRIHELYASMLTA